jgi:lipid-A-disaccharide synthase-like uncharacterized protein
MIVFISNENMFETVFTTVCWKTMDTLKEKMNLYHFINRDDELRVREAMVKGFPVLKNLYKDI